MNSVAERYVELGLRVNKLYPPFTEDKFFGPPGIKLRVDKEKKKPLKALLEDANLILESLKGTKKEDIVNTYLKEQTEGLSLFLSQKISPKLTHKEFASKILQVKIDFVENKVLKQSESRVRDLLGELGYKGDFRESLNKFLRKDLIKGDELFNYFSSRIPHYRKLSRKYFNLPKGEKVEVEKVDDRVTLYIMYEGNYRTTVKLNSKYYRRKSILNSLIAHETYPGHHVNYVLREKHLKDYPFVNFFLYNTPECTIVEGIGEWAEDLVEDEEGKSLEEQLGRELGSWRINVGNNAALLLYDKGLSKKEVREYLVEVGYHSKPEVRNIISFITVPSYDVYYFTYKYGYEVVKSSFERAKKNGVTDKFLDFLYCNHITPNMLKERF